MFYTRDALGQATLVNGRTSLAVFVLLIIFISVGLITAVSTFGILSNYPTFSRPPLYLAIAAMFLIFFLSPPILWCVALVFHDPVSRTLLKIDAAFLTADLVADIWLPYSHAASVFVDLGRVICAIFIIVNLWVAHISYRRAKGRLRRIRDPKFLYLGLTIPAIVGLYTGVETWSSTMPARVVAAAEAVSQGQPYCIIVDGRPARSAKALTGTNMQAEYQGSWAFNFHSLLVVKAGRDSSFFNWSYRTGRFEPVGEHARFGLDLDSRAQCEAEAHLARAWVANAILR
jgi:hypothetical protein